MVLYLSEAIESESYLVIASGVGGVSPLLSVKPLPSITGGLMLRERDSCKHGEYATQRRFA